MFVTNRESNYDGILSDLLQLAHRSRAFRNAARLDGEGDDAGAVVALFGTDCLVRPEGIYQNDKKVDTLGSILAVRYLLQGGEQKIADRWLPYRDLKDGALFSSYIKTHIEDRIAEYFAGKLPFLRSRLEALNAVPWRGDIRADLALVVRPLSRVPVLCLFTDNDKEFPASFQIIVDASDRSYLDLEALAAVLQYIYVRITGET
jgi:hypothetical protein